jgi:hypothetical protein
MDMDVPAAFERVLALLQRARDSPPSQFNLLRPKINHAVAMLEVAAETAPFVTPPAGAGTAPSELIQSAGAHADVACAALDALNALAPIGRHKSLMTQLLEEGPQLAGAVASLLSSSSKNAAWRAARALAAAAAAAPSLVLAACRPRMGPIVAALAAGMRAGGAVRASCERLRREAAATFL